MDYLSAGALGRLRIRVSRALRALPSRLGRALIRLPARLLAPVRAPVSLLAQTALLFRRGDTRTRLSFLIMGLGCFRRGRFHRALVYMLLQLLFWVFFFRFGIVYIGKLSTLGTEVQTEIFNEASGIFEYVPGDNSMLILLYGITSLALCGAYLALYFQNIRDAYRFQLASETGGHIPSARTELCSLMDENFHIPLLTLPILAVTVFTVLPLLFMILISLTNYDRFHMPPGNLFTWVGLENFRALFGLGDNARLGDTFGQILLWTLVWAFFSTVTNYVFGMLLALLIGRRGIRAKGVFRTVFVLTIAIPQFVSLLFMRNLLADTGLLNVLLTELGLIRAPIRFLTDGTIAKYTVILVNMWIGIPYSMLITTGILMNIPADLYEASRIDGASPITQFFKITLPYVLFVTMPYLITQFVGNINNFNVIWLLSGGGPMTGEYYQGGRTDLLITWLYRLTTGEQNYKLASVIGIITFAVSAAFSLFVYSRSISEKRGSDFQ